MITTIALAVGLSCTTVGTTVLCEEVDGNVAEKQMLMYVLQRKCMSKVMAIDRSKYPGGFIQLVKDCEEYAKLEAKDIQGKAMRNVDQNGVQPR